MGIIAYGSAWRKEFFIRNFVFIPSGARQFSVSLINGSNSGKHDFSYTCYIPQRITIDSLYIDDSNHPVNYQGPAILVNFNPKSANNSYHEKFLFSITKEVILRNVTTVSGKDLKFSDNPYIFKDTKVDAE